MSEKIDESVLFVQNTNKEISENIKDKFFTIIDHADFIDEDGNPLVSDQNSNRVYAKKILKEDSTIKYMVKTDTRGKLFNPISIYGQEKTNNFLDKTCKDSKFTTVNFKVFDMYVKFLSTKNLSWLHNAEREAE